MAAIQNKPAINADAKPDRGQGSINSFAINIALQPDPPLFPDKPQQPEYKDT